MGASARRPRCVRALPGRIAAPHHRGFVARDIASGGLVGVVNLNDIVLGSLRSASLGYYGFESTCGGGRMTEAVRLAVDSRVRGARAPPARGEHPTGQRALASARAEARFQARGLLPAVSVRGGGLARPRAMGGAERGLVRSPGGTRSSAGSLSLRLADLAPPAL